MNLLHCLFGNTIQIGKEKFTTKQIDRADKLVIRASLLDQGMDEGDTTFVYDVLGPTDVINRINDYIKRVVSIHGIRLTRSEKDDQYASLLRIEVLDLPKQSLARQMVESILNADLYCASGIRSIRYLDISNPETFMRRPEHVLDMERLRKLFGQAERGKEIRLNLIHYVYAEDRLSVAQNSSVVSSAVLISHVEMLLSLGFQMSGSARFMDVNGENELTIYTLE